MPDTKKVLLLLPHMIGGGAERVGALLMDAFYRNGYAAEIALTSDRAGDVVRGDLSENVGLTLLPEILPPDGIWDRIRYGLLLRIYAQVLCNLFELFRRPVPARFAKASLYVQYHREIAWLKAKLQNEPGTAVIAFLQPAVPIAMLASRGLPNRVLFSERGDPNRLMAKRYGKEFIQKYYLRADAAVFQTEAARGVYPQNIAEKGEVIPNPLKTDLPAPYCGERSKRIVTFCRISREKNLPMLTEAFALFRQSHPDYTLGIYGDAGNEDGERVKTELETLIRSKGLEHAVSLLPFSGSVHEDVLRDAMYINSSDREGLSNAMLEALAVGLPCVCTDCPVGGARSVIRDGENGLLVPVGDREALCSAMARIADDPALAAKLSRNAAALRTDLSLENVSKKWMELL